VPFSLSLLTGEISPKRNSKNSKFKKKKDFGESYI
jgi:hypothetical protein